MSGGFKWVGSDHSDPSGKIKKFSVDAGHSTLLSIGDAVVPTSTADANEVPGCDAATAGADLLGIIVGFEPDFATENFTATGLAASTAGYALVNTDPRAEYEVDVSNGPLAAADVQLNADLVATEATTSGGITTSNMTLNDTGAAATATLQFRILKRLPDADGVMGNRARVRVNESSIISGALGV